MGEHDGRLWAVDAATWQPAVDAWTADLDLAPGPDGWVPVRRNAFGTMRLRAPGTDLVVTIHPARGWIFPARGAGAAEEVGPDDLDVFDVDDRPLHERALARLGPVGPDTVYAFAPTLGEGGEPRLEALRIEPAVAHVVHLAAVTRRTLFPDVTTR